MKFASLLLLTTLASSALADAPQPLSDIELTALELIKKLPESPVDIRILCISGEFVVGAVPMTNAAKQDRKTAYGTLTNFPARIMAEAPPIKITAGIDEYKLLEGDYTRGFRKLSGNISGEPARFCVMESKPFLEKDGFSLFAQ
jgi:hypothetical protein